MEGELPVLLPLLQKLHPRCMILDSYFVMPGYMAEIREKVPLVYIDDQNAFDYPADLVVNYTLYADELPYPQNKLYLLGPKYAMLRREFQSIPRRQAAERVKNVLLSTGGTDPEHVALKCVQYLREQRTAGVTYHVVLGAMNPDVENIERLAAGYERIVLHRQVSDMCALMLECDAAVSAGGTTLFELCVCGLPTVTYVLADNQIKNAASFVEMGLMLSVGDVRRDMYFVERMFQELNRLSENPILRENMSKRMQAMIDGNGAERLAKAICRSF